MKKYIIPQTQVIKVEVQSMLMQMSASDEEIDGANAGLVKDNRYRRNRWDDYDWDE